jgi:hypothetical protein
MSTKGEPPMRYLNCRSPHRIPKPGDLAAKRLYRIAQGFSPGKAFKGRALKVAPHWALSVPAVRQYRGRHVRALLQGAFLLRPNPGLKPWAVLYSRFAAKSAD